jgi:hypothetical protein
MPDYFVINFLFRTVVSSIIITETRQGHVINQIGRHKLRYDIGIFKALDLNVSSRSERPNRQADNPSIMRQHRRTIDWNSARTISRQQ